MLTGGGRLEINGPLAGGFRFANLASYRDVNFLPGAVKYGELPALLALSAPQRLLVLGETEASLDTVIRFRGCNFEFLALIFYEKE